MVSRQVLIDSRFSTVICAPVNSRIDHLATQVVIGTGEGLKHDSSINCDELVSVPKALLTNCVGTLGHLEREQLDRALRVALALDGDS